MRKILLFEQNWYTNNGHVKTDFAGNKAVLQFLLTWNIYLNYGNYLSEPIVLLNFETLLSNHKPALLILL